MSAAIRAFCRYPAREVPAICCRRMKRKHVLRYVWILPVIYILFQVFVKHDSSQYADNGNSLPRNQAEKVYHIKSFGESVAAKNADYFEVVHLAVSCGKAEEARELGYMLKTLLFYRRFPVHLHALADDTCTLIIRTLFDTWEIDQFIVTYYKQGHGAILPAIHAALPSAIDKVIYVHQTVRFLDDVTELWTLFKGFSQSQYIGLVPNNVKPKTYFGEEVVLLRLDLLRESSASAADLQTLYSKHRSAPSARAVMWLPCSWRLDLTNVSSSSNCLNHHYPKAAIWNRGIGDFVQNHVVESIKERIITVLETSPYTVRQVFKSTFSTTLPEVKETLRFPTNKSCAQYRFATSIKRRTHLFFIGTPDLSEINKPNDITLLTQLTTDRFDVFEKIMNNWEGPAAAVFHVSDAESLKLSALVSGSKSLSARSNIAYHLVYKRQRYYPINYLRNVALNQTRTPYVLFVDVDLVPNPGLYPMLKQLIPKTMAKRPNVTLVVPAFEALQELTSYPKDKDAVLQLMKDKKVIGYRMNRGWNLGHKPTNYNKWQMAEEVYKATWKDAFEPYVVMRTGDELPRYHEGLLERMGDKIAYGREIYARGYEFWVMPDAFVIHLPHPKSEGTQLWLKERGYMRCGSILINEFKELLKKQHPNMKF